VKLGTNITHLDDILSWHITTASMVTVQIL